MTITLGQSPSSQQQVTFAGKHKKKINRKHAVTVSLQEFNRDPDAVFKRAKEKGETARQQAKSTEQPTSTKKDGDTLDVSDKHSTTDSKPTTSDKQDGKPEESGWLSSIVSTVMAPFKWVYNGITGIFSWIASFFSSGK